MNILALDTSTEGCSVALLKERTIIDRYEIAPQKHTELILPMIEEVLNLSSMTKKEINAVAFTEGPGSFTGLRIAIGVAQGLCFALDIPAIPLSTLRVIAQRAFRENGQSRVLVALDARMQEIYWGAYQLSTDNIMQKIMDDTLSRPEGLSLPEEQSWFGAGNGWQIYSEELKPLIGSLTGHSLLLPHARDMIPLALDLVAKGQYILPPQIMPQYLRNKVVQ